MYRLEKIGNRWIKIPADEFEPDEDELDEDRREKEE